MPNKNSKKTEKKKNEGGKKLELQIQELAETIDTLEDEKLEITNQLKKALADYQNLEKDIEKLIQLRFLQTKKRLAEDLIHIVDSLTIALKSKNELKLNDEAKAWVDGISASLDNLEKALENMGLTKFEPKKGDEFDSDIHEAITTTNKGNENCIFDVLQPGYKLDGVVIRPARVVVSK